MSQKRICLVTSILLIISFMAVSCQASTTPAVVNPTTAPPVAVNPTTAPAKLRVIKIGFQGALTGDSAVLGIPMANAAKLAIEQAKAEFASKGIDLQYAEGDDQVDPAQSPEVARKMIDDPTVVAMVGPMWGNDTIAAAPLYTEAHMTMISAGTAAELTTHGWTFFRMIPNDDLQGAAVASYMSKVLNLKKIAVINDGTSYGSGLAKSTISNATSDGMEVVVSEAIDPKSDDWSPTISKIITAGAEGTFMGGSFAQIAAFNRQLSDKGYKGIFFAPDGALSPDYISVAGAASEGTLFTSQAAPPPNYGGPTTGPLADFVSAYTAAYGAPPQAYSAEAYDATNLIISGLRAGNYDRASIVNYILNNKYQGITRLFEYDANGEPKGKTINIYKIESGKIQWLGTTDTLIK
jgi:branched-chain amino acid transport system substrate-binding protein